MISTFTLLTVLAQAAPLQKPPVSRPAAAPFPVRQKLELSGVLSPDQEKAAARFTVNGSALKGIVPRLWAGITLGENEAKSPEWPSRASGLAGAGAGLIRFAPLSETGVLRVTAKGEPAVRWEIADAALERIARKGLSLVLVVSSPPPISLEGWTGLVASLVKRYRNFPLLPTVRWEFAGTEAQAKVFYGTFAKTVRQNSPTSPIGIHFSEGFTPEDGKAFAALCTAQKLPLDSLGWPLNPRNALADFSLLHKTLSGKLPGSVLFCPELGAESLSPARSLSLLMGLLEAAPPEKPNGLLGVFLRSSAPETENFFTLLNQNSGLRLGTQSAPSAVHAWTTRTRTGASLLLVNEGRERFAVLTLKAISAALPPGAKRVRLRVFVPGSPQKPVVEADFLPLETDIPLLLLQNSALRMDFHALPASPYTLTLALPKSVFKTGDNAPLTVNLLSSSPVSRQEKLRLSGNPFGVVSAADAERSLTLQPNAARAFRIGLISPLSAKEGYFAVTSGVGENRAGLLLKQEASFTAKLLTPRVTIPSAGQKALAKIRLTNASPLGLPIVLVSNGSEISTTLEARKKPIEILVPVSAPSPEPGLYRVPIDVSCFGESGRSQEVTVAVPLTAHYRSVRLSLSSIVSGNEWHGSDLFGAGRADFAGGRKPWKGPADLSFLGGAEWDNDALTLVFEVTDDRRVPPLPDHLESGDALFFKVAPEGEPARVLTGEMGSAAKEGSVTRFRLKGQPAQSSAASSVLPTKTGVRYAARVPWKTLGIEKPQIGTLLRFGVRVQDVDAPGGLSGDLSLGFFGEPFALRLDK